MNDPAFNRLAQRLVADPSFLSKAEVMALRELLIDYAEGVLDDESNREVESLLNTNPKAAAIHAELTETDKFLSSTEGKELVAQSKDETRAKLNAIIGRSTQASSPVAEIMTIVSDAFQRSLENLSAAVTELFTLRIATASGEEGLERRIDDGRTLVELRRDSAGRIWLQVTSKNETYRNGVFKFEVEHGPSLLRFTEVNPGVFSAQVCVPSEIAEDLAGGANISFLPAEPPSPDTSA